MQIRTCLSVPILAAAVAASALDGLPSRESDPLAPQRMVQDGIAIELEMIPVAASRDEDPDRLLREGAPVRFRFSISDETSGTPLSGLFPAAWMDLRPRALVEDTPSCQEKVEAFIAGSLLAAPELDLNVYYVLTLNGDATLSVVDPLFGFGTTKLLAMVFLPSPGEDWALDRDQAHLFVSLPQSGQIAVVDTATWKLEETIDVGVGPRRVALQSDDRYLWVAVDGTADSDATVQGTAQDEPRGAQRGAVVAVDTIERKVAARIDLPAGHHDLVLTDDDRHLFVTSASVGTVTIVDVARLAVSETIALGGDLSNIAFSSAAQAAYAVDGRGVISAIDARRGTVVGRVEAEPGIARLRFAPDGRLGFLVNPTQDLVHILDASMHRIIQTADVEDGPDQVTFTDHLAYIRHSGSETVLMVPLEEVGVPGKPVPVIDFPGGQQPFGLATSPADGIVQAPGATAVLVANPADRSIYFYKEGMAAPMGHFKNYSRQPRAVQVIDRSLRESQPGVYETVAQMRTPGDYHVAFFLDAPRAMHCFDAAVGARQQAPEASERIVVWPVPVDTASRVGQPVTVRFRLIGQDSGDPANDLGDVRILTFRAPGRDRRESAATPRGDGFYEVELVPNRAGVYYGVLESRSAGIASNSGPFVSWRVQDTVKDLEGSDNAPGSP